MARNCGGSLGTGGSSWELRVNSSLQPAKVTDPQSDSCKKNCTNNTLGRKVAQLSLQMRMQLTHTLTVACETLTKNSVKLTEILR